jgi:hypothetical protein
MDKIIFFTILVLFPFGQLIKFGIFNLFDFAVVVLAIFTLYKRPKFPNWYRYFIYFLIACVFSLFLNYKLTDIKSVLYLFRLFVYSLVPVYITNFVKDKKHILNSLLVVALFTALFGWIQYLVWPNLTSLKYFGWDDHLLRLSGTFLDPTFTGLIFVLGIILAFENNYKKIAYLLIISLAFTYSRSSYMVASLFLIFRKKYLALLIFVITIFLLPKMIGEGTNLSRTTSGNNKLINYQETIEIIKESPVFGIGFNNICNARVFYLNDQNRESHSCNGSDSSILFLLATTGVVGLFLFASFILRVPRSLTLVISFLAVVIHSLFANSLFYPHIMFWIFAIIGLQTKK